MRDINRIPEMLSLLEYYWKQVPDWRFGQFIENLKRYIGTDDLFYIEDEDLINYIKDYFDSREGLVYPYNQDEICPACGVYTPDGNVCTNCQKKHNIYENTPTYINGVV